MELLFLIIGPPVAVLAAIALWQGLLPAAIRWWREHGQSKPSLEILRDALMNLSMAGFAAAALVLGKEEQNALAWTIASLWFVGMVFMAWRVATQIAALEEAAEKRRHRQMAGTMRSIVKSELPKALSESRAVQGQAPDGACGTKKRD